MKHSAKSIMSITNTLVLFLIIMMRCTEVKTPLYAPVTFNNEGIISPYPELLLDSSVELSADAYGSHNLTFTWIFIDTLNQLDTLKIEKHEGDDPRNVTSRFTIDSLNHSHFGTYFCIAYNDNIHFGVNSKDEPDQLITSYDTTQPFIVTLPEFVNSDTLFTQGTPSADSSFALFCGPVKGSQPLRYFWMKDTAILTAPCSDTLYFTKLTKVNSGVYRCIIVNSLGKDTSVPYDLKIWEQPEIVSFDAEGKPLLQQRYILNCRFTGTSPMICAWYKGDVQIATTTITDSISQNTFTDSLVFASLSDTNAGHYRCIIRNDAGKNSSAIYNIRVYSIPFIQDLTPVGKMFIDSSYEIAAEVFGSSPMQFVWFKDGQPIDNDTIITTKDLGVFNKIYRIPSVKKNDAGVYSCMVRNAWGKDLVATPMLHIENRPPQWKDDTLYASVMENSSLNIDLKTHCVDPEHDVLSFAFTTPDQLPQHDTLTSDGIYTFNPGLSDSGTYFIGLQATDGNLAGTATMQLKVKNNNNAPEFIADSPAVHYTIKEGDSLKIFFGATDKDGDYINYVLEEHSLPAPAPFFEPNLRRIFWKAGFDICGEYSLRLLAHDGIDTARAVVTLTIDKGNAPPIISILSPQNQQQFPFSQPPVEIKTAFYDREGFETVRLLVDGIEKGTYTGNDTTWTFHWKPELNLDAIDTHIVTAVIMDNIGQSDTAEIKIDITGSFYSDTCAIRMILNENNSTIPINEAIIKQTDGRVSTLTLTRKNIRNMPPIAGMLQSLQTLDLSENYISEIPESIDRLITLDTLILFGNSLTGIPEPICNVKTLQYLDVSYNPIKKIPKSIENLQELKSFILVGDSLSEIPESIKELHSLQELFLGYNTSLRQVPEEIYTIHNLRLLLNSCSITAEGLSINSLNNLNIKKINIDYNKINPSKLDTTVALWLDQKSENKEKWRETQDYRYILP